MNPSAVNHAARTHRAAANAARRPRTARILALVAAALVPAVTALGQDTSAPATVQIFEASWRTLERRAPDLFMAGYGGLWTPPPGRAESGNQSVGYDVYDRFDLGSPGNPTLYGTETGLKSTVAELHKVGVNVYTDLVWNHNGFANQGTGGFAQAGGYPGFALSFGSDADGDFHSGFATGDYAGRTSDLIDIAHEKNYPFIRNPVPGFADNLPSGASGGPYPRTANVPSESNRRFYPDLQSPARSINGVTYHAWNSADPFAGDPVAENATGYLMRHTRWMIDVIGVDGFRLDATKHMVDWSSDNPAWVLDFYDIAANAGAQQPLLDGSRKRVFAFGEYLDTNVGKVQATIKKDANANRDALDFALHYALKNNLTGNGLANNWHNIVNTSQDVGDDGLANNGSQGVAFDASHDDGGAYLGNVANAYLLMRPGNAVIYMNAKEFGGGRDFPKDGRGDALGGYYGNTITKLVDIRNTHGRGNFVQRYIDNETLVFEREKSLVAGYNNRLDNGFDERTVQTAFAPGTHLVELTGNAADGTVDPFNDLADTVVVNGSGQVTVRLPRNRSASGVEHGKGYVLYGLQNPKGNVSVSNVLRTIAGETPTAAGNGTQRLTAIDIVRADSFDFTLNTTAVTLSDGFRDRDADGDNAVLRVDAGLNVNGNAAVDYRSPGSVVYGFEEFATSRSPGYDNASGNGSYVQTIDATQLSEGYHYLTARAFRRRTDGGPAVFSDFRKVVYVDRLRPQSVIAELKSFGSDDRDVIVRSTDQTATGVHVFHNLGANQYTDAQLVAMAAAGSNAASNYDRDLFKYGVFDLKDGNHAFTVVTFEMSYDPALGHGGGGVNVQRFAGVGFNSGAGLGLADLNFNDTYEFTDVTAFGNVLASNNVQYNPAGDLNADGSIDEADNVLNVPWLVNRAASAGTINSATQLRLTRAAALDGTLHVPAGTLNVSGTLVPATPLTFNNSFNIPANETITKTGGQALNVNAPQAHGANAVLAVAEGVANIHTNGGANLTVTTTGAGAATHFSVSQSLKAIHVGAGGTVTLTPSPGNGGGKSVGVTALSIAAGAKLDLANNNLAVNWTGSDPLTALTQQIATARNGGAWDGPAGIFSSTAAATDGLTGLVIAPASDVLGLAGDATALWAGQQVDATTVLIKYTYEGDATLDGRLDADDYGGIDFNVLVAGATGYHNGDFNFDGVINADDYGVIDYNILAQGEPILSPSSSTSFAETSSVSAVPEPGACGVASVLLAATALRRRRNGKHQPGSRLARRFSPR